MKTLGLFLFLISQIALATGGDRVGNGGDVVFCTHEDNQAIYVLDEYEAGAFLKIGDKTQTYYQKVELILAKIQTKFPVRYHLYRKNFERFKLSVKFIQTKLPEINDSFERTGPLCYTRQIAYFNINTNGEVQYFLQRDLWSQLSEDQRAIVVLHELIYTEAVGIGHFESTYVRAANRILITVPTFFESSFENLLMKPYRFVRGNQVKLPMQLKNSYSPEIAILFLDQSLQFRNADKTLSPILEMLKKRFAQYPRVLDKIDQLMLKIEAQR